MKKYKELEEMPASIQSWAYQMSSSSDSGGEYEYYFLPGMQNTIVRHRAISNAHHQSIARMVEPNSDSDSAAVMDEDSAGSEYNIPSGELEDSSWGCRDFIGRGSKQIRSWGVVSLPHTDCTTEDVSVYGTSPHHQPRILYQLWSGTLPHPSVSRAIRTTFRSTRPIRSDVTNRPHSPFFSKISPSSISSIRNMRNRPPSPQTISMAIATSRSSIHHVTRTSLTRLPTLRGGYL